MKSKKLLTGILSAAMVLGSMSLTALADEGATGNVKVSGIAGFENKTYATIQEAFAEISPKVGELAGFGETTCSRENFEQFYTDSGKITWTITGTQTFTADDNDYLFSFGRQPAYYGENYLTAINIVGGDDTAELVLEKNIKLPYDWWGNEENEMSANFSNLTLTADSSLDYIRTVPNFGYNLNINYSGCTINGKFYSYWDNFALNLTFDNCNFNAPENAEYAVFTQGSGTGTITINECNFTNYTRGVNFQKPKTNFVFTNNTIESTVSKPDRGAVQITDGVSFTVTGNTIDVSGGNAFWFHSAATNANATYTINDNNIKAPYLANDDTTFGVNGKITASGNNYNNTDTVNCMEKEASKPTKSTVTALQSVAKIGGDKEYTTLEAAVNAAQNGDTVKLLSDTVESVTITAGKTLTLDLNGHKLTNETDKHTIENSGTLTITDSSEDKSGTIDNVSHAKTALFNNENATATLDGGTFERSAEASKNNDSNTDVIANGNSCYTVKNLGTMVINDGVVINNKGVYSSLITNGYYNIAQEQKDRNAHATLTINGGVFTGGKWTVKNDDKGELTINDGEFYHSADFGGVVLNNNTATITGGTFTETGKQKCALLTYHYDGGNNTGLATITGGDFTGKLIEGQYSGQLPGDIQISGGTFSTDVSRYTVPGFAAKKVGDKWIVDNSATELTLGFKKTATDERVYDIIVTAVDAAMINRLNTAELTFNLTATSEADSTVTYEILPVDKITVTPDNENTNLYMFNFNGKDVNGADTANEITVGQVRFEGYTKNGATITFKTDMANSFVTATTKDGENVVTYFDGNGTLKADTVNKIDGVEFAVPTNKLTVNITFPNAIADQAAAYQDMKVVISGGDLPENLAYDLGSDVANKLNADGAYVLEVEGKLTENTAYTVTVSGAGYRTARYTVTMTADKTLNFWNNVKDTPAVVEEGKDASKKSVTFLAGDIVTDGKINIYDLSAVVSYFGTINDVNAESEYAKYDLNRDGKIDSKDVAYVLVSWGK